MKTRSANHDASRFGPELLELLRRNRGLWVTGEAVRLATGLAARRLPPLVAHLREAGYDVEAQPGRGFRLVGHGTRLSSELISCGLGTRRIGRQVLVYETTDSTNNVAWQYVGEPGYDGLAVFAEEQRAGRGRLGHPWLAPKGSSILGSILLQDAAGVSSAALSLLAGLATATALESVGVHARIKWPNDVTVGGQKLAGTMVEARSARAGRRYVLGIGVNCQQQAEDWPTEWRQSATSLRQVCGQETDRVHVAQQLLRELERWLAAVEQGGAALLHEAWLARCDDVGRRLILLHDGKRFTGRVVDVSPERGLLLQLDAGPVRVFDAATTTVLNP